MKCTYCGADIEENSKFCTNCGKETVTVQQENNVSVQPTPVIQNPVTPQPVPVSQPPQKKNNTIFIVIGAVVGAIVLFGIIAVIAIGLIFSNIMSDITSDSPFFSDYEDLDDGKVIKTIKDPTGHEIQLVEDSVYIIKTETSYLYDVARELRKTSKLATREEVDALEASDIEKLATKKAISYLTDDTYAMDDLKELLEEDGFEENTINFAIEHCGVDWKEQTKIRAVEILAAGGFSREDLINLLVYEGFDEEYAKEAADDESMNYYEQAIYDACFYKYTEKNYGGSYTRSEAERMLKGRNYTEAEIRFALKTVYDDMDD